VQLKCSKCGKVIESIPTSCGYSISYDDETKQWGCHLDNCGFVTFDTFLCEDCCKKKVKLKEKI